MTRIAVLAVLVVVLTAGCTTIFGGEDVATESNNFTSTNESVSPSSSTPAFNGSFPSERVILSLSDLDPVYDLVENTLTRPGTVSEEQRKMLEQERISRYHERVFEVEDITQSTSNPDKVVSSITVYEGLQTAENKVENTSSRFQEDVTTTDLSNETTVRRVQTVTRQGTHVTMMFGRVDNIVLFAITEDSESYYGEKTRDLFLRMYLSVPNN